jgi:hypothetical protein
MLDDWDDGLSGACDECGEWSPCRTSVRGDSGPEVRICSRCLSEWYGRDDDNEYQPYDEEGDDGQVD